MAVAFVSSSQLRSTPGGDVAGRGNPVSLGSVGASPYLRGRFSLFLANDHNTIFQG